MTARVQLFVFDLAGTTVVDDDRVLGAFLATAEVFELPVDRTVLRTRMGWHKHKVFATLLEESGRDPDQAGAMAQRFEQEYAQSLQARPPQPTPGAADALRQLAAGGVQIAFNTGFSRRTVDQLLPALGWQDWPSVASDEVAAGRPAPDLIQRAMEIAGVADAKLVGIAGDTPADLEAGAAAGAGMAVGVGCGTHTLDELASFPHTLLLPDLTGLPEVVFGGA